MVLADAAEFVQQDEPAHVPVLWPVTRRWTRPSVRKLALGLAAAAVLVVAFRVVRSSRDEVRSVPATGEPSPSVGATEQALSQLPSDDADAVRGVLRTLQIELPASVNDLRGRRPVLRGSRDGAPRLIDPIGTRVSSTRPEFTWEPVSGATYQVTIFDAEDREVESSGWLDATRWMPAKDLRPGAVYVWTLGIMRGTSILRVPAIADSPARFQVLSTDEAARIAAFEERASGAPTVLGILMVRAGMLADAEAMFAKAAAQEPRSEIPQRLLSELRAQRSTAPVP
jgi:hypothetical protein